jgi:hypothetical protein
MLYKEQVFQVKKSPSLELLRVTEKLEVILDRRFTDTIIPSDLE